MTNKKFIHIDNIENFNMLKLSANPENTAYTVGHSEEVLSGEPDIPFTSIVFIRDKHSVWTHGSFYAEANDIFNTEELTTVAVGGIGKNVDLNNYSYAEIFEKMLYVYVAPTYSSVTVKEVKDASGNVVNGVPSLYEKGITYSISKVASNFTKGSKSINLLKYYSDNTLTNSVKSVDNPTSGTTYALDKLVSGNDTFSIYSKIFDGESSATKNATLTFTNPVYTGILPSMSFTGADIVQNYSTKELKFATASAGNTMTYTFKINKSTKYYPFIAYPASWKDLVKIDDGSLPYTETFDKKTVNLDVNSVNKNVPYKVYINNVGFTSLEFKYIYYF